MTQDLERQDDLLLEELLEAVRSVPEHFAAPTATARGTPAGLMLKDGYSTKITFASRPTVEFWEKMLTPPGYDSGDKIAQSTMFNTRYRTYEPRSLIDVTDSTIKAAWNPLLYSTILNLVGIKDTISFTFPDGSTLAFYGFLKSFVPDQMEEGKQPEATLVIVANNRDSSLVEQAPVETDVAGT